MRMPALVFSGHRYLQLVNWILSDKTRFEGLANISQAGSYLVETGWFRTIAEKECVDASGSPIPWITYSAIHFLLGRLSKELSVFEYGTGGSTQWWAERVRDVVAVEHDRIWHKKIVHSLPDNVELILVENIEDGSYANKINEYRDRFDIVVIDGRDRVNCVKRSLRALKASGVIVWDNTDRKHYAAGIEFLRSSGFRRIEFSGLNPLVNFRCETSIFYRDGNVLGI